MALRDGVRRYRTVLGLPGARRPVVLSALGSMPIGMFGLGILLLAALGAAWALARRPVLAAPA